MKQYELFINGEFIPAGDRGMIDVLDPATEQVVSQVPRATADDAAAAVSAAYEAQKSWGRLPAIKRAEYLMELSELVRGHARELARISSEEMGKPLAQSEAEAVRLADCFRYHAAMARHIMGEIVPSDKPNENLLIYKMPIGVVAGILPWNFPLFLIGRKAAPALIAGDTIVLKPSSDTPNGCCEFARLVAESSLPRGVINILTGSGAVTGEALAADPRVALVTMTGSTAVGKKLMQTAAKNVTKVSLELGGKAPVIVMDDCDLDRTVENVFSSRVRNSGQACNSAERIYVQEGIADVFTAKMVARFKKASFGPALAGTFDLGPMVNRAQQEHVDELVRSAVAEGCVIRTGGRKASVNGKGFFYEPTVITGCRHGMRIMREEIFGPVMPIATFKTLDEAIELANDCEYGLTSSIHTQDYNTVMRALNEIRFGETYVNRPHGETFQGFHQGVRQSGIGGDDGEHGLEEYLATHICYLEYDQNAQGR